MDARHLTLLRELADRGSVAAVAAATHRTPSAVSQQLRTATRELGVALIEPHGRGIRLTDAGALLAAGAVDVETALAEVQSRLDTYRGHAVGEVTVAALPSAALLVLPDVCAALAPEGVDIRVRDVDLPESGFAPLAADHDIVIGHSLTGDTPAGSERLVRTVLAREPIDVAVGAGHRLARRPQLRPEHLAGEPWITVPDGFPFAEIRRAVEMRTGMPAHRVQEVRDNALVAAFVAAGLGIGLLPRFSTPSTEDLVLRPLVGVPAVRWIVALSRPDRARRAVVRRVMEELTAAAPDSSGLGRPTRT